MKGAKRGALGSDIELALDFADTVDWRTSDHAEDQIGTYSDLVEWSQRKGLLDQEQAEALNRRASRRDLDAVVADARRLREAIYRTFSAIAHGKKADRDDVKILNEYLAKGLSRAMVQESAEGYNWGWRIEPIPDMMLYPVASSAASLLTSESLVRVRECANEDEGCGSLFIDSSKSLSRKWCSMESCGNRTKFQKYYDRHLRVKAQ